MKIFKNINIEKLKSGLSKTRDRMVNGISEAVTGKANIDETTLEEIEEILITSDIGYDTTQRIIDNVRKSIKSSSDRSKINILNLIQNELVSILDEFPSNGNSLNNFEKKRPYVILIVGVNGTGKTTTIGKLAYNYKKSGLKVVIGSADTFRAAANEQLEIWAKRSGVDVVQKESGADPSSVAFDTINFAIKEKADIVLIDTAGRLHTKNNLMKELEKISNVIGKIIPNAPDEILLVIDGNSGQNALIQASEFSKYTKLSGLIITKLDGTAKGGVVFQVCSEQKIPVKYVGVGEGIEDLQTFETKQFVDALFS